MMNAKMDITKFIVIKVITILHRINMYMYVYIYTYIICCLLYENEEEKRMYVYDKIC